MKVIVDNLAVEYQDSGSGPLILMLHGWGNTLEYFDSLCNELDGFRIVRVDLPGFGGSEQPSRPWDVSAYVGFVDAFCRKLDIHPPTLLGHSFGGRIITKGVGTGRLRAERLILIGSAGVANRRTARNALYAFLAKAGKILLAPLPSRLYERFRRTLYWVTGSDYLTIRGMKDTFLNMIREDLSEHAKKISVPVLIIWGEHDEVTPLSEGKRLHALIRGSRLEVIPKTGHFVYQEAVGRTAELIKTFV